MKNQIEWLVDSDPSIRWQVKRDLLEMPDFTQDREAIANEGWGKRLLDVQDMEGTWSGKLYSPKWTSTHYTLLMLKRLGLPQNNPKAQQACQILLEKGLQPSGGVSYWKNYPIGETCVTGMTLGMLAYFGVGDDVFGKILQHLAEQKLPDGAWNCNHPRFKVHHSSMHTTISVLEGLQELAEYKPHLRSAIEDIRSSAHEFLLQHRLYKSDKTAKIIDPQMTRLIFPQHWHYHVHIALDYFQKLNYMYDERFNDAIDLIKQKQIDGRWPMHQGYSGKKWFTLEPASSASRINSLIALRILKWWDSLESNC